MIVICDNCKREFEKDDYVARKSRHHFCCIGCYQKWQKGRTKGKVTRFEKQCEICGKTFITHPSKIKMGWGRFCSRECANIAQSYTNVRPKKRVGKPCVVCGKMITGKPSTVKKRKFCSLKCAYIGRRKMKREDKKIEYTCANCGEKFKAYKRKGEYHYCCCECYHSHRKKRPKHKKACGYCGKMFECSTSSNTRFCSKKCADNNQKNGKKIKCKTCGKSFYITPSKEEEGQRFCSRRCFGRWLSTLYVGKNNPAWNGGTSRLPYRYDFKRIRRIIIRRDNYTCFLCSKPGKTVHHIDYDKMNTDRKNLITLCRSCHSSTNVNRNFWEKTFSNVMDYKYGNH